MNEISSIPITIRVKYDGNRLPVSDGMLGAIMIQCTRVHNKVDLCVSSLVLQNTFHYVACEGWVDFRPLLIDHNPCDLACYEQLVSTWVKHYDTHPI